MVCQRSIRALVVLGCLFLASPLLAQTVNPNVLEFLPPYDASLISRYDIAFYPATALDPFLVVSLGKPAPQADGMIRSDITSSIGVWPQPNAATVARIVAVTTSGPDLSVASNQFTYICDFSLSSTAAAVGASGGTGTANVSTATWCGWTAKSSVSWITVTAGASGTGNGNIGYSVAPNTATTSRSGTITAGTVVLTITQGAASSSAPTNPTTTTPITSQPTSPPPTTRVDLATPGTYTAAPGGVVAITLNWYRVPMAMTYLQFMFFNGNGQQQSVDDHDVPSSTWPTGRVTETRRVTVPTALRPGTYDIRVGLAGGSPWTDLALETGPGVTDPDGNHHYKVGTLTVAAPAPSPTTTTPPPNVPPTVRIVRPSSGDALTAGSVRIDAQASDSDGTIASVAFYANGTLIGTSESGNPTMRWRPAAPGSYTLKALATDNRGATTWSAPVSVTVR